MFLADSNEGYKKCKPGDLVINTMWAWMGALGVSRHAGIVSPSYNVYRPLGVNDSRYFDYLFRTSAYVAEITRNSRGVWTSRLRLYPDAFLDMESFAPPLSEQREIADFLDRKTAAIDALIVKKERLIELLRENRQGLITQAVTRGIGQGRTKPSGSAWLGDIPAHWQSMALRHVVTGIEQGWSPPCEARPAEAGEWGILKAGCTAGGIYRNSENKALPSSESPRPEIEVLPGDLVMSRASGSKHIVGSCAIAVRTDARLMLSDKHFRLKIDGHRIQAEFLWLALASHPAREQIELSISGAEGLANNLPQAELLKVRIAVPPVSEQRETLTALAPALAGSQHAIESGERSIELLREYRQAVTTAAVTGRIDVTRKAA